MINDEEWIRENFEQLGFKSTEVEMSYISNESFLILYWEITWKKNLKASRWTAIAPRKMFVPADAKIVFVHNFNKCNHITGILCVRL